MADDPGLAPWFVGNLSDPWVVSIADALPASTKRLDTPGDLPEGLFETFEAPARIVLHRSVLTRLDFQRVARWRGRLLPGSRLILCFGPHVRHSELGFWSEIVDASIPEATACETVANHLVRPSSSDFLRTLRSRSRIGVVSALASLRETVADVCESAGFTVLKATQLSDLPKGISAVWDVPTLEPSWSKALEIRAEVGPIVALLSFADRALVSRSKRAGAFACLDMPLDLAEIPGVLDRIGWKRVENAHDVPPSPAYLKRPAESDRVAEGSSVRVD